MSHLTWDGSLWPSPLAGSLALETAPQGRRGGVLEDFHLSKFYSSTDARALWVLPSQYLQNLSFISASTGTNVPHTVPCMDDYLGAFPPNPPFPCFYPAETSRISSKSSSDLTSPSLHLSSGLLR